MFCSNKMEEYMEAEFSGIFWVKIVSKNVILVSPGTHFMLSGLIKFLNKVADWGL